MNASDGTVTQPTFASCTYRILMTSMYLGTTYRRKVEDSNYSLLVGRQANRIKICKESAEKISYVSYTLFEARYFPIFC